MVTVAPQCGWRSWSEGFPAQNPPQNLFLDLRQSESSMKLINNDRTVHECFPLGEQRTFSSWMAKVVLHGGEGGFNMTREGWKQLPMATGGKVFLQKGEPGAKRRSPGMARHGPGAGGACCSRPGSAREAHRERWAALTRSWPRLTPSPETPPAWIVKSFTFE